MTKGSLYRKLFAYFFIVITFSLITVGIFTYSTSSKELDVLVEKQMRQIVDNSVHHTDLYLKSYERSIVSLLTNRSVKRFLDLPTERNEYEYYKSRRDIFDIAVNPVFIRNPEITSIYILSFNENGVYYYNDVAGFSYDRTEIREQLNFFKANTSESGSLKIMNYSALSGQKDDMLTLVRQVRGLSSPRTQGILAIEFYSSDLSALWQGVELGENGYFFIVDAEGNIIYHPHDEQLDSHIPEALKQKIVHSEGKIFSHDDGQTNRMYMSRSSGYSGWHLVASMPVDELMKPIANIRFTLIAVGLITLVIALAIAYRFGKSITNPIRVLISGMRETEKGNWQMIPLPDRRDEIVELMMRYNLMVNRLSDLVDKVYQAELNNQVIQLERQKAEFQSLQLQINPHFLYNTLETIVCYAVVRDSEEISEIVRSLAYMLRYSAQTNIEEITVANELKHVMHFMIILRHRIGVDFELDVEIQPKYLLHKMVRLTLQPLVENIFQHAFPEGLEDYHYIKLNAGEQDGYFWLSVEDNGIGMKAEKLEELRSKLKTNRLAEGVDGHDGKRESIGILNVHRRIQMVFGEECGLRIESEYEKGTTITMIMLSQST